MATFGGTNAGVLKKGLDSVFETGNIPIDDYQTKLVSATADGANVNDDDRTKALVGHNTQC